MKTLLDSQTGQDQDECESGPMTGTHFWWPEGSLLTEIEAVSRTNRRDRNDPRKRRKMLRPPSGGRTADSNRTVGADQPEVCRAR